MKNFTKMKTWLMLMVMSFMLATPSVFADGKGVAATGADLTILPGDLDIGLWPVGGWQEAVTLSLKNTGTVKLDIKDSDLDDPDGAFSFTSLDLPHTLNVGEEVEVGFSFTGATAGTFEGVYVASFDVNSKSVATSRVTVESYMPSLGDIFENPFLTADITFPHTVAIADIQDNYNTPTSVSKGNGTKDAVYAFTLTSDDIVTVSSSNVDAVFAIYGEFPVGTGPMDDNSIVDGASINSELFAGNYYLVASCNTDFDVDFASTAMPMAAKAHTPDPADGELGINPADVDLAWLLDDAYAFEYQVVFGTEYPPTEASAWAPVATTHNIGALDNNTQYFWQVNLRNSQGVTEGDVWGFTTKISVPMNVVATVADTNDVTVTWNALTSKVFLSYNIFRDGVMLNTAPLTTNTFADMDVAYNMTTGYDYTVTAVYDEGESDATTAVNVKINGAGMVNGVVTELLNSPQPIAGAMVTFKNTANEYVFTTDAVGAYEGYVMQNTEAIADDYTITVTATDFTSATLTGVEVPYNTTVTNSFELDEFAYAPESVIAVIQDTEEDVLVSWTMASKGIQKFEIYRYNCDESGEVFLGEVLSGSQFIDNNWGVQTWGEYKYGVKVVYDNATSEPTFSTPCLQMDMDIVVDVKITTNSDDSPAGTMVTLVNTTTDETFTNDPIIGDDGLTTFFPMRKGDSYDITVSLDLFGTYTESLVLTSDTLLEIELIEEIVGAEDLYVTPLGFATWKDPSVTPDLVFLSEGFDTEIPADWGVANTLAPDHPWEYYSSTSSNLDGEPGVARIYNLIYNMSFDASLITPEVDASSPETLTLEFDQYFNVYSYGGAEIADVDVWDGTAWVNVLRQLEADGNQGGWFPADNSVSIDITDYKNAALKVRFHYYDTDYDNYWAVDNILISGEPAPGKEFLSYSAWHNGNFAAQDLTETNYQYGDNVNNVLVAGETYFAEVAKKYETGNSARINYTWTYLPCDSFPGNDGMMASYVEGTANNMVIWDALSAVETINGTDFEVMGTNIYRNDVMVDFVAIGTSLYLDTDVAPGAYIYCTEVVYSLDEGDHEWNSCSMTCAAEVVVPIEIVETVTGYVYDAITNDPIANAILTLDGVTDYTIYTDETGMYSQLVVVGDYDYNVVAGGYIAQDLLDVAVVYGTPVVNDFYMNEFPFAVANVHAEELSDSKVNVTWGEQAAEAWFQYDVDDMQYGGIGSATGAYSLTWAIKVMPADLAELASAMVTKVEVAQAETDGYVTDNLTEVRILSGENGETVLYTQVVTGELTVPGWTTISLDNAVEFDHTAPLWIAMYAEREADMVNEPISTAASFESDLMDLYKYNSDDWTTAEAEYGIQMAWMLRGYATTETGKEVAVGNVDLSKGLYKNYPSTKSNATEMVAVTDEALKSFYAGNTQTASKDSKELMGYNVYRTACGSEDLVDAEFLGYTLDSQFTDNAWGTADWGIYSWAVEAVYTNNVTSLPAFSAECWDKDMNTVVNMEVTTTSGDAASGTSVVFVNTMETVDDITTSIPGSGLKTIDPFRKGTYDITVAKTGFLTIELEDVVIHDTTTFVWVLEELLSEPGNLYVTPTGLATWTGLGGAAFEPYMATFDTQEDFDMWEVIHEGSSAETWKFVTDNDGNTLDGTPFAFVDADAGGSGVSMDEYLVSPIIDASATSELYFDFDMVHQQIGDVVNIDVYNGSEWITIDEHAEDTGAYPWGETVHFSYDISEYANAELRVRFHYIAGWDWFVGIDNVVVTNEAGKSSKEIVEYLVYHDDANTNNVGETIYQYGLIETEVLVSGVEYKAEVAAAYTTGISEKAMYMWTYLPCDSFPAYAYANAENVDGTNDVLVNWSSVGGGSGSGPADYYEMFEGTFPPAGWLKANPDGGTGFEAIATGTTPLPGWTGGEATACPDGGDQMAYTSWEQGGASSNDQWLISPMLEAYDGYELSFYMDVPYADSYTDNVDILISTTGTDVADFTVVVAATEFNAADGWILYTYDLVGLGLLDSGDEFYVGINEHIDDNFNAGAAVIFDNFFYGAPSKKAQPVSTSTVSVGGRNLNSNHTPAPDAPYQVLDVKSVKADAVVLGTNIYRDAEFIAFVSVADTFYMDMDLEPGLYDYCVATVFTMDAGVHTWESCAGENCIEDVLLPEDCIAPTNLIAQDLLGDGYTATLSWGSIDPQSEWLFYDTDAMNYGGIGAEASDYTMVWAIKFTPADLEAYGPGYVTKISVNQLASVGDYLTEARVMSGDGMNVLYAQDVTGTLSEGWNEIELDQAVAFDNTEDLWIGMYVERPGVVFNEPTAPASVSLTDTYDFFAYNGGAWTTITGEYNAPGNSWMLRGFVTNSAGKSVALGHVNTDDYTQYTSKGQTGVALIPVDPNYVGEKFDFGTSSRSFLGYNIYRDGSMIEENWPETGYADDLGESVEACYVVTANYEFCGESAESNEACVTPGVGVGNVENNISVYPNPAKDFVTVEASNNILTIKVTNYMGQVISYIQDVEVTSHTIATSSYSSGVYFVEVGTATGVEKVRIVISE